MVSKSRKMRPTRKIGRTDGGNMLKTSRGYVKREKEEHKKEKQYERLDEKVSKKLGTQYIEDKAPHKWKCSCGNINYGGIESKVGNAVIVRCSSCEGSAVREIKS